MACLEEAFPPKQQHALALAAKSTELNPVENIWQLMRDNWLSNRAFKSYEDILDHYCFAWDKLIDMPWKIMSIGSIDWLIGHNGETWYYSAVRQFACAVE
jgi:transposase